MAVEIGINPITWTNDDMPELGGDIPLETCLAETRAAGYAAPNSAASFRARRHELGPILAAASAEAGVRLVRRAHLRTRGGRGVRGDRAASDAAARSRLQGGGVCRYVAPAARWHLPAASQRPALADDEWPAYGRKITALAERMAAFGVRMAFHHHMGTIVQTDAEIDRLMATTGEAVGLLYDTGHCLFAGGDPAALLARHIARVVHVHCKDVRRDVLRRALAAGQ